MKGHIRERIARPLGDNPRYSRPADRQPPPEVAFIRGTKREAQIESARLISAIQGGTYLEPTKITLANSLSVVGSHEIPGVA